jgi:aminoglycoside/choline kinase family phosphotransferase
LKVSKPDIFKLLERATITCSGEIPVSILPLPVSGSTRQYFRIKLKEKTIVGVWSNNRAENSAFIHFTEHFRKLGLNVPELFFKDLDNDLYLVQDLGDETLYSFMTRKITGEKNPGDDRLSYKSGEKTLGDDRVSYKIDDKIPVNNELTAKSTEKIPTHDPLFNKSAEEKLEHARMFYQSALKHLIRFQIDGPKGLDFSHCIPRPVFDEQSILWDLQYFKYYVLKLFNIPFDEQKLEEDFIMTSRLLASVDNRYFMYRDFQSRNILMHKNDLYFVDYQGGRRGPLHYDLASLLFEARIDLPTDFREELTDFYVGELSGQIKLDRKEFLQQFYLFVFLRILQVLAAYGLRGYVQNKSIFLRSYPFAVNNLEWLLDKGLIKLNANELLKAVEGIIKVDEIRESYIESQVLNIYIHSFSYKYGIPKDFSSNGGGFVFDCRIVPNPGRYTEFREMTGTDEPVIRFLEKHNEVKDFLDQVRNIMDIAIKDYSERGMNRLMVSFGCTGGQHRSVYCAEKIAEYISEKHKIKTNVVHGYYKNIGK